MKEDLRCLCSNCINQKNFTYYEPFGEENGILLYRCPIHNQSVYKCNKRSIIAYNQRLKEKIANGELTSFPPPPD